MRAERALLVAVYYRTISEYVDGHGMSQYRWRSSERLPGGK
ncbi:hypothetical protein [Streptomyces sp. NBC_00304]|nr:hypothetical protein [Streptomyces sp. NBC_00304]